MGPNRAVRSLRAVPLAGSECIVASPTPASAGSASLAYAGVLLFVLVYFTRPSDWIPGAAQIPFAKIAGILAAGALLLSLGRFRRNLPREVIYLLLLFVQLCLTVPFAIWRGGAFNHVLEFSKVVLITLVISFTVTTLPRLRRLIFLGTACLALTTAVTVLQGHTILGRLEGAVGGDFANPNDLGLAIALNLPFLLMFLLETRKVLRKLAWIALLGAMIYALTRTASRSASIALLAAVGVCLWEFAIRGRRRYLLGFVAAAGLASLLFASNHLTSRFEAISNPRAEGYGSAMQREQLLWRSLEITEQHPLFGIGPGNFTSASGMWRTTHNSYTLMSAEAGLPALILYLMIFWRALANVRPRKAFEQMGDKYELLRGALRASLIGYLIGSFFSSVAYAFFPYLLVAYTASLAHIVGTDQRAQVQGEAKAQRLTPGGLYERTVQTQAL